MYENFHEAFFTFLVAAMRPDDLELGTSMLQVRGYVCANFNLDI